jgi:hypothetical protein
MPKKFDDYYDRENQVQYTPQTWGCPKCEYQIQVLSAVDVSHKCPKNDKKVTFFNKVKNENCR